jgi:hypothetical protein
MDELQVHDSVIIHIEIFQDHVQVVPAIRRCRSSLSNVRGLHSLLPLLMAAQFLIRIWQQRLRDETMINAVQIERRPKTQTVTSKGET